jgi:hypothetical protein
MLLAASNREDGRTDDLSLSTIVSPYSSQNKTHTPSRETYFNRNKNIASHNVINSQRSLSKAKRKKPFWLQLKQKHDTKQKMCVLLDGLQESELKDKMQMCSARFGTLTCGSSITERRVTFHCSQRFCPFCASIRSKRLITNYLPKVQAFYTQNSNLTPVHLILTQKHYPNELLSDSVKRIQKSFRKLIRREFFKEYFEANQHKDTHKDTKGKSEITGGLYAVEFTVGSDGAWHTHLHCLVFRRRWFPAELMRAEWFKVTGDSINLKIVKIDTLSGGLREVVKYLNKPLDVDKYDAKRFKQILDLKSIRMFSSFGAFRSETKDVDEWKAETTAQVEQKNEGDACGCCQQPLFLLHLSIEKQIAFERHLYESRRFRQSLRE